MRLLFFRAQKGSILILVLWLLAFIATFAVSVNFAVRQKLHAVEHFENRDKLRRIADAGIKRAIYILNSKTSKTKPDFLSERWANDPASFHDIAISNGKFSVYYQAGRRTYYGAIDEESKINLNMVKAIPVLINLFQNAAGLKMDEAHTIAASIVD